MRLLILLGLLEPRSTRHLPRPLLLPAALAELVRMSRIHGEETGGACFLKKVKEGLNQARPKHLEQYPHPTCRFSKLYSGVFSEADETKIAKSGNVCSLKTFPGCSQNSFNGASCSGAFVGPGLKE